MLYGKVIIQEVSSLQLITDVLSTHKKSASLIEITGKQFLAIGRNGIDGVISRKPDHSREFVDEFRDRLTPDLKIIKIGQIAKGIQCLQIPVLGGR